MLNLQHVELEIPLDFVVLRHELLIVDEDDEWENSNLSEQGHVAESFEVRHLRGVCDIVIAASHKQLQPLNHVKC